jgi:hypothetical protein
MSLKPSKAPTPVKTGNVDYEFPEKSKPDPISKKADSAHRTSAGPGADAIQPPLGGPEVMDAYRKGLVSGRQYRLEQKAQRDPDIKWLLEQYQKSNPAPKKSK